MTLGKMPHMNYRQSTFSVFAALLIAPLFGCMASNSTLSRHDSTAACTSAQSISDILSRVNRIRAAGNVCGGMYYPPAAPLRWSSKLQQAAVQHSQDMASHNFFNHKSATNGSTLTDRLKSVGYKYQAASENIGAGPITVAQILDMWLDSPGHCVNLMTATFTELGVSCQNSSHSTYKTYWTMKAATPS